MRSARAAVASLSDLTRTPQKGGQRLPFHRLDHFTGRTNGFTVFFFIRALAITVFEINAKIFDRLFFELMQHPRVDEVSGVQI